MDFIPVDSDVRCNYQLGDPQAPLDLNGFGSEVDKDDGDLAAVIALAQVSDAPPPLPEQVPAPVRALLMSMLSKDPRNRPANAIKFAEAPVKGASVLKYDPQSNAAGYYRDLAKEVLAHESA